jgi:hypothetical protein
MDMGADAFLDCYGLRWEVDAANEEEITLLEKRKDPRQLAAKRHTLNSWWVVTTDQGRYFLIVGALVGNFGREGDHALQLTDSEATVLVQTTKEKLLTANFERQPTWHFQFEPDY